MAQISTGSSTAGKANVDATYNLNVALPTVDAQVGSVRLMSENDDGTLTGTVTLKPPETSPDYRLRAGLDTVLFTDSFNASTQNTNNWNYISSTMTASQPSAGTLNFGTVQGTVNGHGALFRSWQSFPLVNTSPLAVEFLAGQFTSALVANESFYFGLGIPTVAGTIPTDGVWFNLSTAGLIGELKYNTGSVVQATPNPMRTLAQIVVGQIYQFIIVIAEREVQFWIDGLLSGTIAIPVGNGTPMIQAGLPIYMQKICTGAVSNTNTCRVARASVSALDVQLGKPSSYIAAAQGAHSAIGQNGHTQGNTGGNVTNAALPGAAAIANATAAASFVGLGGQFVALAQAGGVALAGDMIACSFQNPAATVNLTGRNLIITGVSISAMNTGAIVAVTATSLLWGVAWGHTAASLATVDTASFVGATTHAPRRLMLGSMIVQVGAIIGQPYDRDIKREFTTPLVVRPGEFIATTVRFRVGTATALQEVSYLVAFDGYWE